MLAQGAREAEDQVVARFVREEQRACALEELGRIGQLDDVHPREV